MNVAIFILFLVAALAQNLVNEVEPNNNDWTQAYDYRTVAPVRIEGNTDGTDVDYFVVDLPSNVGSPEWSVSVFDSCSVSENTVNPIVLIHFEDMSIVPVGPSGYSWSIQAGREQTIVLEVRKNSVDGAYGVVVLNGNGNGWDGNCNIQRRNFVFENEPNDVTPQDLETTPVRVQATISDVADVDVYSVTVTTAGDYFFITLPYSCSSIEESCIPDLPQPSFTVNSGLSQVSSAIDTLSSCSAVSLFLEAGSTVLITVTSSSSNFAGGYGLVARGLNENFLYTCVENPADIPEPPPEDPLGRWICMEPAGNNAFDQTVGTLSVPFFVRDASLDFDEQQDFYYFGVRDGYYAFFTFGAQPEDPAAWCPQTDTCEFDTVLSLYDMTGTRIALSDDTQYNRCSGLAIYLTEGNYYVVITSFAGSHSGSYALVAVPQEEGGVFFEQTTCPNFAGNGGFCPTNNGSGLASGSVETTGSYYDNAWWIVLVILAIIFAFPLLILIIYFVLLAAGTSTRDSFTNTPTPPPVRSGPGETHKDDHNIDLDNSENVDGPPPPGWRS